MNQQDILIQEIINIKMKYRQLSIEHWLNFELFTWVWWLGVASVIVPLILWWKMVDRKRILDICIFGLVVNIAATFLDVSGSEYVLWEYTIRVIPHIPLIFPVDYILLPVVGMLIYQYFPNWKRFLFANTVSAAVLAFIVEPFATMIHQYKLIHWKYIYSFPIYILIAIFAKLVTQKLLSQRQEKS
ncbi:MAG: hypothetical protein N2484_06705 [Clostridia bacterium]|nr:hypothetical protein [Clostridia bacterium]